MNLKKIPFCQSVLLCCVWLFGGAAAHAISWYPHGPDGGDARAFAPDPHDHAHLYLGTTNGWLYETHDGGKTWSRGPSRVGERDDLILDSILVDPEDSRHLIVGAYLPSLTDGGIYTSHDGGQTWISNPEMKGQPVLSMAEAPSDPRFLVAGTMKGVYRSQDGGVHWALISPEGSKEIYHIESLAIDPRHPDTIYAGTWHLPWKTVDGGAHWEHMNEGIIDDSDVFSIIIDPKKPSTIYLSACSGIYKSVDTGKAFVKMKGIPPDARRTRKLRQDPEHLETVFAGTTLGLYRTVDGGAQWQPMTEPSMIVNDVYVDPTDSKHVLLATDHVGVMESDDGGLSFFPSNDGFSARQIMSVVVDPYHPSTVYAGVMNDKDSGGMFVSLDGGLSWTQDNFGLNGADVRSLTVAPDGSVLAGTEHGIYLLGTGVWTLSSRLENPPAARVRRPAPVTRRRTLKPVAEKKSSATDGPTVDDTIYAMASTGNTVFAATSSGLLLSGTSGRSWRHISGVPAGEWDHVAAADKHVLAAQLRTLAISSDEGLSWTTASIPAELTQVSAAAVDPSGGLWVGGREGVFYSDDRGASWHVLKDLGSNQVNDIHDIYYDAAGHRMLVTGNRASTYGYAVSIADKRVTQFDAGWNLRMMRPVGDHLLAATLYDGVVIQPRWVDSPVSAAR